ncbi:MAG: GerMN domain-containing protein [Patescibacteria group bacterium]
MKNKLTISLLISVVILAVLVVVSRLATGDEDTWFCQAGQWVKRGNPSASQPVTPCGQLAVNSSDRISDQIQVIAPATGATVTSPLEISGQARGTWFFEASFPVKLLDSSGQVLASGLAEAQSGWMTTDWVPFIASLNFTVAQSSDGVLVLAKDNPSDLSANDAVVQIPLQLASSETSMVRVYFNNSKLDPESSCSKVFAVDRQVPKTQAVARAALEQLLAGPLSSEIQAGFFTSINPGVKIQKLTITDGVATVDLSQELEGGLGGSCRVTAIRSEITETLKQFATVQEVIISVDGRIEDILQP